MALTQQLDGVIERTRQLIERCEVLKSENELLKQENEALKAGVEQGISERITLEEKLRAMAVARTLNDSGVLEEGVNEKTLDIKQKINEFVREIDKCIVLLKK